MTLIEQSQGHDAEHVQHNTQRCEHCGALPPDRFVRDQHARDSGQRYRRRRTNRVRVSLEGYYAQTYPELAAAWAALGMDGKLVCAECQCRWQKIYDAWERRCFEQRSTARVEVAT